MSFVSLSWCYFFALLGGVVLQYLLCDNTGIRCCATGRSSVRGLR